MSARKRDEMYWPESNELVNGLGRGSRIVLGFFSGLAGLVMVVAAPPKLRATVPGWAHDRREEIALPIAEAWKPKDFHLPNDLKGSDAGG
jgi:hypothetical protein